MQTPRRGRGAAGYNLEPDSRVFTSQRHAGQAPQTFARALTLTEFAAARGRTDFDGDFVDRSPAQVAMLRAATWGRS